MIQRMLLGRGIGLEDEDSKYISKVDGREHLLINKYKRRVRRLVGVKEKEIAPDDSLAVEAPENVQERVLNRSNEEDLLVKRYWFDGLGYQLTRTRFDDLFYGRSIEIGHGGFEPEAGGWIPHRTSITISDRRARTAFPSTFPGHAMARPIPCHSTCRTTSNCAVASNLFRYRSRTLIWTLAVLLPAATMAQAETRRA